MLALVTDAFGGRGGIAQYNRDLLGALAGAGAVSSITVLPRLAPDPVETPTGITQDPPRRDRVRYAFAALRGAHETARSYLLWPSLHGASLRTDRAADTGQAYRSDARDRGLAATIAFATCGG